MISITLGLIEIISFYSPSIFQNFTISLEYMDLLGVIIIMIIVLVPLVAYFYTIDTLRDFIYDLKNKRFDEIFNFYRKSLVYSSVDNTPRALYAIIDIMFSRYLTFSAFEKELKVLSEIPDLPLAFKVTNTAVSIPLYLTTTLAINAIMQTIGGMVAIITFVIFIFVYLLY